MHCKGLLGPPALLGRLQLTWRRQTQYSLSHDPNLKGAPTGFTVPIRDVRCSPGAGYLYAKAADIQTIPGLPTAPGYLNVDVDPETGEIEGLF